MNEMPKNYQPKQLNPLIMEYMDKNLIEFFNNYHHKFEELTLKSLDDLVNETLIQIWPDINTPETFTLARKKLVKVRTNKRGRWYKQFKQDFSKPFDNKKNPVFKEATEYLTSKEKLRLYGDEQITPQGIVSFYEKMLDEWFDDRTKLLIDFPLLNLIRTSSVYNSFLLEIRLNIYTALLEICDGNINKIYSLMFDFITDNPILSISNRAKINFEYDEEKEAYYEEYHFQDVGDSYLRTYITPKSNGTTLSSICSRLLDAADAFIIAETLQNFSPDFLTTKKSIISLYTIAKHISGSDKPGKKAYALAKERCFNLLNYSYELYENGTKTGGFNVYSSIVSSKTDNDELDALMTQNIIFTYSEEAFNNILQNKLSRVLTVNMNKLQSSFCRIIYHALQNERISMSYKLNYFNYLEDIYTPKEIPPVEHSYTWFQLHSRMVYKSLKKNIDTIIAGLNEFKELKIAVKDFKYENYMFTIYYYPLSTEEIEDLKYFNRNLMIEKIQ